jgi:hypothetical protein
MNRLTASRRGLLGGGAAVVAGLAVVAGGMSPAHAEVDPFGAHARFVHLYDKGCTGAHYRAEGYLIDGSGAKIPDSTWKVWEGDLDCNKVLFAWAPADETAQVKVDITSTRDGKPLRAKAVPGDENYCLKTDRDGNWLETTSSVGDGGSGECTAW